MNRIGRPRDTEVDEKVLRAVAELLRERGYRGLKIDEVVRRSGVVKTTIYRRWPSLTSLAVAAYVWALGNRSLAATDDVDADLQRLLELAFRAFEAGGGAFFNIGLDLAAQNDVALHKIYRESLVDPLREAAAEIVERGVAQGVFSSPPLPPVDLVDAWIGLVLYRRSVLHEPMSFEESVKVARSLLGAPS